MTTTTAILQIKPGRRKTLSARDVTIIVAIYVLSFLTVAGFPHIKLGFPLDDSWIHQVIARNLAQYRTLGFAPGIWSSGSSSLLWTVLLAAKYIPAPSLSPVLYCGFLNLLLLASIGIGLLATARNDGLPEYMCWVLAIAPACDGNFIWLGLTGMESVLFIALSVASVYFWFQPGSRSTVFAALGLGALVLTRPEGIILGPGLAVVFPGQSPRTRRDLRLIGTVVGISALISLTANIVTSHSWISMTYEGRKWLHFGSAKVPLIDRLLYPLRVASRGVHPWMPSGTSFLAIAVAVFVALGGYRLRRLRSRRWGALCLWTVALLIAYSIMLPTLYDELRYQCMYLCLMMPLICLGWDEFLDLRPALRGGILLLLCAIMGAPSLILWRHITEAGIMVVQQTHERAAAYVKRSLPPQSQIAAFDIGALGYQVGGNRVKDLGGLTDSSYLPYLTNGRILDYLNDQKIDYVMWVSKPDGSSDLPQFLKINPAFTRRFARIAMFCTSRHAHQLTNHTHAQCQAIYRRIR